MSLALRDMTIPILVVTIATCLFFFIAAWSYEKHENNTYLDALRAIWMRFMHESLPVKGALIGALLLLFLGAYLAGHPPEKWEAPLYPDADSVAAAIYSDSGYVVLYLPDVTSGEFKISTPTPGIVASVTEMQTSEEHEIGPRYEMRLLSTDYDLRIMYLAQVYAKEGDDVEAGNLIGTSIASSPICLAIAVYEPGTDRQLDALKLVKDNVTKITFVKKRDDAAPGDN